MRWQIVILILLAAYLGVVLYESQATLGDPLTLTIRGVAFVTTPRDGALILAGGWVLLVLGGWVDHLIMRRALGRVRTLLSKRDLELAQARAEAYDRTLVKAEMPDERSQRVLEERLQQIGEEVRTLRARVEDVLRMTELRPDLRVEAHR